MKFAQIQFAALIVVICMGCEQKSPTSATSSNHDPSATSIETEHITKKEVKSGNRRPLRNLENAKNWAQFRGPAAKSIVDGDFPRYWTDNENILWKTELVGRGGSSPIVFGDRVFVTSASGYGSSAQDPGKHTNLKHHLLCVDYSTGKINWQRDIKATLFTQQLNNNLLSHGFASSTPVTDGKMIYVFFGAAGVFAFDMDGNLAWQADVGFLQDPFGSSASLTLVKDLLIVNASVESQSVFAINKNSGQGVWRIEDINRSWSTPVIGTAPDGQDELVIMEKDFLRGFNPETGDELWHCDGIHNYVVSTPIIEAGICYCNGGIEKQLMAIKLGGRGDVTETHTLWNVPFVANVVSPVLSEGIIYLVSDSGMLQCFDAASGELVNRRRLSTKSKVFSSPLLVGDELYIPLEAGNVYICQADTDAKKIALNKFNGGNSLKASFAATDSELFIRDDDYLYCISHTSQPTLVNSTSQFENELITPVPRFELNTVNNSIRIYNRYLYPDDRVCKGTILAPYKSIITEAQTTHAYQIIDDRYEQFHALRKQQNDAYWEFLKDGSKDRESLNVRLLRIETDTEAHANRIRVAIKQLFSKEQMEQHLKEAAKLNQGIAILQEQRRLYEERTRLIAKREKQQSQKKWLEAKATQVLVLENLKAINLQSEKIEDYKRSKQK
jgi:outer membrane protein assembly factor BamB